MGKAIARISLSIKMDIYDIKISIFSGSQSNVVKILRKSVKVEIRIAKSCSGPKHGN